MNKIGEIFKKLLAAIKGDTESKVPFQYRIAMFIAIAAYLSVMFTVFIWVDGHKSETLDNWYSRIPSVSTIIGTSGKTKVQVVDDNGTTKPAVVEGQDKSIIIIISDLGMSANITAKAIYDLPKEFVLAFSPYSENLDNYMKKSKQKEHENILLLPMEDTDFETRDSGSQSLSSRLSKNENQTNLESLVKKGQNSIGMMNYMGSSFMKDKKQLEYVFDALKQGNLGFIENPVAEESSAQDAATTIGMKYLKSDLTISGELNPEKFIQELQKLEKIAQNQGHAIGIIQPYPAYITTVRNWALGLNKKGFTLASLSTLWKNINHYEQRQ